MKKEDFAICALIRIYRKKYNLSQSELADGICVPSYVSKIENAEIEPNEQIIELLLKKFGINFYLHGDFSNKESQLIAEYFESVFYFDNTNACVIFNVINKKRQKFINSTYLIDYLMMELHQLIITAKKERRKKEILELLKSVENIMTAYHKSIYYFLYAEFTQSLDKKRELLEIALVNHNKGYYFYKSAYVMLSSGHYTEGIQYLDDSDEQFMNEGNFRGLIYSKNLRGEIYYLINDYTNASIHYKSVLNLLNRSKTKDDYILAFKYFAMQSLANIAYSLQHYDEVVELCEKIIEEQKNTGGKIYTTAPYLLLSEYYYKNKKSDLAKQYLNEAKEMQKITVTIDLPFEIEFCHLIEFRINNVDYMKMKEYEVILLGLKQIVEQQNIFHYQRFVYQKLKKYYVANKRYKEAFLLAEKQV